MIGKEPPVQVPWRPAQRPSVRAPRWALPEVRYVFYTLFCFLVLCALDAKLVRLTDYGLERVDQQWRGNRLLFAQGSRGLRDEDLAARLAISERELRNGQYVAEAFLNDLEERAARPTEELISITIGDNRLYLGAEVFLHALFALVGAGLLRERDRLQRAQREVEAQTARHERLTVELASRVAEGTAVIEKLNTLQDKLVEAEKLASIGRMSATLAHEIRNPLTIIKSSIDFIREDLAPNRGSEAAVEVIREEVARLDRIISDLLNFARPKPARLEPHGIKSLVRHWLPPVVEELEKQGIQVVPQFEEYDEEVSVDPDQLYQVFLNIVWNARDALVGTRNPHLFVRCEDGGPRHVRLVIQDTGPGMLPETLAQIREPFFTTKTKGTGLGIPVSMQLMEGMGGRLEIVSQLDAGTAVGIYLRRAGLEGEDVDTGRMLVEAGRRPSTERNPLLPLMGSGSLGGSWPTPGGNQRYHPPA